MHGLSLNLEQKRQLIGFLEYACASLEITNTQQSDAESKYNAVAKWLRESSNPLLTHSSIYPQGSIRIGTTVRPIRYNEFDIDLICHVLNTQLSPNVVHELIGIRLRKNGMYEDIVEPLKRGWRINYANDFHLDITPAKDNLFCPNNGVLVTDKKLEQWKPSNPKGYASWFSNIAELAPSYYQLDEPRYFAKAGSVEQLPEQTALKGVLKRTIQIMKRNRDIYFSDKPESVRDCAPISIIITTLAAMSYKHQVLHGRHDNDLDLLMAIVRSMPDHIERYADENGIIYQVMNPTTEGENFAEKWNEHPERADWFYQWHNVFMDNLEKFVLNIATEREHGIDSIGESLSLILDKETSTKALGTYTRVINAGRDKNIFITPNTGVISMSAGIAVNKNIFFGK